MVASIIVADGIIDALQLDELIIWPSNTLMNVTLAGGDRYTAGISTSWLAPELDFQFHIADSYYFTATNALPVPPAAKKRTYSASKIQIIQN